MVQMKGGGGYRISGITEDFISHMVQMKVLQLLIAVLIQIGFISHMVQMKVV